MMCIGLIWEGEGALTNTAPQKKNGRRGGRGHNSTSGHRTSRTATGISSTSVLETSERTQTRPFHDSCRVTSGPVPTRHFHSIFLCFKARRLPVFAAILRRFNNIRRSFSPRVSSTTLETCGKSIRKKVRLALLKRRKIATKPASGHRT